MFNFIRLSIKKKLQNTDALFEFHVTTMLQAFIIVYTDPRVLIMC